MRLQPTLSGSVPTAPSSAVVDARLRQRRGCGGVGAAPAALRAGNNHSLHPRKMINHHGGTAAHLLLLETLQRAAWKGSASWKCLGAADPERELLGQLPAQAEPSCLP